MSGELVPVTFQGRPLFLVDVHGNREPFLRPPPPPPLSKAQITKLLAYAIANDNRDDTEAAKVVWLEHSVSGRWTFDEALAAMRRHYRESPGVWLMPGRISQLIGEARQEARLREETERARVVDPDARDRVLRVAEELAAAMGPSGARWVPVSDELAVDPRGRHVPCDRCGAAVSESCRVSGASAARRPSLGFVHPSRLEAERLWVAARRAESGTP